MTTAELINFLGYARASAGEVRSMMLVVMNRPRLRPVKPALEEIAKSADSCVRQIVGWTNQIESGPIQGKRHLTGHEKRNRQVKAAEDDLPYQFLISLTPTHPLYNTPEAQAARAKEQQRE